MSLTSIIIIDIIVLLAVFGFSFGLKNHRYKLGARLFLAVSSALGWIGGVNLALLLAQSFIITKGRAYPLNLWTIGISFLLLFALDHLFITQKEDTIAFTEDRVLPALYYRFPNKSVFEINTSFQMVLEIPGKGGEEAIDTDLVTAEATVSELEKLKNIAKEINRGMKPDNFIAEKVQSLLSRISKNDFQDPKQKAFQIKETYGIDITLKTHSFSQKGQVYPSQMKKS